MRLPAKIRYGVRIMVEVGRNPGRPLPLAMVEQNQLISAKFAKQILQPLMRARLAQGVRGMKGGYQLLKKPEDIRLLDIVNALSRRGDKVAPCLVKRGICRRDRTCGAKKKWEELQKVIDAFFFETTLQDMIDSGK